jgi:hypothetical protein
MGQNNHVRELLSNIVDIFNSELLVYLTHSIPPNHRLLARLRLLAKVREDNLLAGFLCYISG